MRGASKYHFDWAIIGITGSWVESVPRGRLGPPGVLGIWGEWLFIFRELRSTGNYFQGFGEQANSFGDLGSPAKSFKKSHLKDHVKRF